MRIIKLKGKWLTNSQWDQIALHNNNRVKTKEWEQVQDNDSMNDG